ncbi:transforming acidic coiled-coil-containing protein 3 isoform X2 [Sphaerodactylus townsendi]|uniref:Uncharacterized protein n=2 Tax=Sphaerodactylus townsendi TaxID=933632 RepID=A0ACB8ETD4_9SAUR|nr:transforming acidic coiled-coil-containing protein 3 isoform X2 [Sphaerodactylus townsendi]
MSLQAVNVENIGDGSSTENVDVHFASVEATSKPSVLCPSQKENVPPKGVAKNVKVTFQIPVWDLQTCKSPGTKKKEVHPVIKSHEEVPENFGLHTPSVVHPLAAEQDAAAATKDKCTEIMGLQAGTSEPGSPVANKISQEYEDANVSKLELIKFDFSGTPLVERSPAKLSKQVEMKTPVPKPDSIDRNLLSWTEEESKTETGESLVPRVSSGFDADTSDDPDLKPLGGCKIQSSPEKSVLAIERDKIPENSIPAKGDSPATQQCSSPDEPKAVSPPEAQEKTAQLATESKVLAEAETPPDPSREQKASRSNSSRNALSEMTANEEKEEFRSPREIVEMNIDYLEQFGMASFKESAWRKQSLYLKFDPLLTESPKRIGPRAVETAPAIPALLGLCTETSLHEIKMPKCNKQLLDMNVLGTTPDLAETSPGMPTTSDPLQFSCAPVPTEAIIDVLKYSQKDMDVAVEKIKNKMDAVVQKLTSEMQEKQAEALEWKGKYEKTCIETQEMGKILAGFEGTITQIVEDSENQKELAKKELQKVLEEKQQLLCDVNSMEKSFADLLKRSEKRKEAIEGFLKNEEALKKCVEDQAARIKREEQRYQALKAHAEEKLSQANEEIAQVRSKAKAELMALQASLRKEQVRVKSLERLVEQKVRENDELTKICDDLISRMEKN